MGESPPRHLPGSFLTEKQAWADYLRVSLAHVALAETVGNNRPSADIRKNLPGARYVRGQYVQWQLCRVWDERNQLLAELTAGESKADDRSFQIRYKKAMAKLDKFLTKQSQTFQEDTMMAAAPAADPHFVDHVYRDHLEKPGRGHLAPDGQLASEYGRKGSPVPPCFIAVRGNDDNFFRSLILDYLAGPIKTFVYAPCRGAVNWIFGRDEAPEQYELSKPTLDKIVDICEGIIAAIAVASSMIVVYIVTGVKKQLIAGSFLCFFSVFLIALLSTQGRHWFIFIVAYWAILAAIVVNPTYYSSRSEL